MKISTISEDVRPSQPELCAFLSRYSASLLGAGATCIRLEKNVGRIAAAYGMDAEMTVMPRHIHLSLWRRDSSDVYTSISTVSGCTSFDVNTSLSRLSWEIADGRTGFADAVEQYGKIVGGHARGALPVLVAVALANASFCRLFGGDAVAMAVVMVATLAGYWLKQQLLRAGVDARLAVALCAFVSSVLGATDGLFSLGGTPSVALGTSVLYLVPGIPFLNSFSDMLYRHYLCAFSRFADALVLTACLSAGLCAGMMLMNTGMF